MAKDIDYDRVWSEWGDMSANAPTPVHTRRLILREARKLRFSSVLDVGCGLGILASQAAREFPGAACAGVDVSATVVARARGLWPGVAFDALDIQRRAPERTFELVICSEVIEHLEEPLAALENMRRACSGHLILTTPTGPRLPTDLAFHHLKHFTPRELRDLVEAAGFEVTSLYLWGWPFQVLFRYLINLTPRAAHDVFVRGGKYNLSKKIASLVWNALFYLNVTGKGTQQVLVARIRAR